MFSAQPVDTKDQQSIADQRRVKRRRALTILDKHGICKKQKEEPFVDTKLGEFAAYFPSIEASL